ncbi:hypothetical protein SSM2_092 [Synechococcus phage S-SM2]|uniref:Uncharacterized protein n=1 Tax=Synechococcus phage S-SM2 TaxID=444860 RepID=E3SIY6_9CAUD|nr:hypothetical protein SSM2_092 [Synechococcus phage S-SM2]ADO97434.1 hypothetical protein SSM2_092 [Synechococcus phage S-SM2]
MSSRIWNILGLLLRCKSLSLAMFRTCAVRMSHSVLMLRKQVMKSGAILGFASVTKKLALFEVLNYDDERRHLCQEFSEKNSPRTLAVYSTIRDFS